MEQVRANTQLHSLLDDVANDFSITPRDMLKQVRPCWPSTASLAGVCGKRMPTAQSWFGVHFCSHMYIEAACTLCQHVHGLHSSQPLPFTDQRSARRHVGESHFRPHLDIQVHLRCIDSSCA